MPSAYIGKMLDGEGLETWDSRYASPPSARPKASVDGKSCVGADAMGNAWGRGHRKCTASSFFKASADESGGNRNGDPSTFRSRPLASTALSSRTTQSVA